MATRVFEGIKFFQKNLKRNISVVSEKEMFKEKVNTQTDARTTDNRP